MAKKVPIQAVLHIPQTEGGKRLLAKRVAQAHADFVVRTIGQLSCPAEQKLDLLRTVLDTVQTQSDGET